MSDKEIKKARSQLDMSLAMIQAQLEKLSAIALKSGNVPLDAEYMTALLNITKTLVMLDKNEKDNPEDDPDEVSNLTFEEIVALAREEIKNHDTTQSTPMKKQGTFRDKKGKKT